MFSNLERFAPSGRTLRIAAYGIPVLLLLIVLYLNYLPFGYDRTFTVQAGTEDDTRGQFYILRYGSVGLSGRQADPDGTVFRTLEGSTFLIFDPRAYLRDADVTVSTDTEGLTLLAPTISWDPDEAVWTDTLSASTTAPLATSSCAVQFTGTEQLVFADATAGVYGENGFSVYASWSPKDGNDGFQQIVGRYGWELLQNKGDVKFQIGSTSIKIANGSDHFSERHYALATYVAATVEQPSYIELYVDDEFAGRVYGVFAETVDVLGRPITLGKSEYAEASFFQGCIHDARLASTPLDFASSTVSFKATRSRNEYPVTVINTSGAPVRLGTFTLHAVQD